MREQLRPQNLLQPIAELINGLLVKLTAAFSRKFPAPVLDIENSKTLLLFWPKSGLQTLLTGTPEGSIFWEHDVTALLTNLPCVFQELSWG
jgi:hypothetical protein